MSKGERTAWAALPDARTTDQQEVTIRVGRFNYRFELWRDILGKRYWKRARRGQ